MEIGFCQTFYYLYFMFIDIVQLYLLLYLILYLNLPSFSFYDIIKILDWPRLALARCKTSKVSSRVANLKLINVSFFRSAETMVGLRSSFSLKTYLTVVSAFVSKGNLPTNLRLLSSGKPSNSSAIALRLASRSSTCAWSPRSECVMFRRVFSQTLRLSASLLEDWALTEVFETRSTGNALGVGWGLSSCLTPAFPFLFGLGRSSKK